MSQICSEWVSLLLGSPPMCYVTVKQLALSCIWPCPTEYSSYLWPLLTWNWSLEPILGTQWRLLCHLQLQEKLPLCQQLFMTTTLPQCYCYNINKLQRLYSMPSQLQLWHMSQRASFVFFMYTLWPPRALCSAMISLTHFFYFLKYNNCPVVSCLNLLIEASFVTHLAYIHSHIPHSLPWSIAHRQHLRLHVYSALVHLDLMQEWYCYEVHLHWLNLICIFVVVSIDSWY